MPWVHESDWNDYLLAKTTENEQLVDLEETPLRIERNGLRFNVINALNEEVLHPDISIDSLVGWFAHTLYGMDYRRRKAEGKT